MTCTLIEDQCQMNAVIYIFIFLKKEKNIMEIQWKRIYSFCLHLVKSDMRQKSIFLYVFWVTNLIGWYFEMYKICAGTSNF